MNDSQQQVNPKSTSNSHYQKDNKMDINANSDSAKRSLDQLAKKTHVSTAALEAFGITEVTGCGVFAQAYHADMDSWQESEILPSSGCQLAQDEGYIFLPDKRRPRKAEQWILFASLRDAMTAYDAGFHRVAALPGGQLDYASESLFHGTELVVMPSKNFRSKQFVERVAKQLRFSAASVKVALKPVSNKTQIMQGIIDNAVFYDFEDGVVCGADVCDRVQQFPPPKPLPIADPAVNPQLASVQIVRGQVTVLGGAPGKGKSTLGYQSILYALKNNRSLTGVSVNVEMSEISLLRKQLSRWSGVPINEIPHEESAWSSELVSAMTELRDVSKRMIFVNSPADFRETIDLIDEYDPEIVIVDYIQRIKLSGINDSRLALNEVTAMLREVARGDRAVLEISALSRSRGPNGASSYENSTGMAALKESGEMEYSVDDAYILTSEPNGKPGQANAVLKHVKSRGDILQDVHLFADFATATFSDRPTGKMASGKTAKKLAGKRLLPERWSPDGK